MAAGNALISFRGMRVDNDSAGLVADPRVAGVVLYRGLNVENASQTRELTAALDRAAGRRLLFAIDQEGGQLLAAGPDATAFPGNMALGAVGDVLLTERVGVAIATELRAMGINVDLAPVADVATRPHNPSMGIRSFGEDPDSVSAHTAAFVRGLQQGGVAATLKHFPGKGEADVDPHDVLPVLDLDMDRLEGVEFAPFRAGIDAGARLLMVGHYGLPAVTGNRTTPTSVSPEVMIDLVRGDLRFEGLVITDALDMGGFGGLDDLAPLDAGADLLLYGPAQVGNLPTRPADTSARLGSILEWLGGFAQPDLDVVGCDEHVALATEVATRSITLVRDEDDLLPLRLHPDQRILAVMPRPKDLTPADTSSLVEPGLAAALRTHHLATTEVVVDFHPEPGEIAHVVEQARLHDVVVVGTIDAGAGQSAMVDALLDADAAVVAVALRTPYDLAAYPRVGTYLCSYGILPPTMDALAAALFTGEAPGRLPVSIPGLYPVGYWMSS